MNYFISQIPTPPVEFYYALTVLFATALIWVIKVYIGRVDATLKQLSKNQHDMLTMLEHSPFLIQTMVRKKEAGTRPHKSLFSVAPTRLRSI